MRIAAWVVASLLVSGCMGASTATTPVAPTASETVLEVWSATMLGADVAFPMGSAKVDDGGIARVTVEPGLRGTTLPVTLSWRGQTITIPVDWTADFALTHTPASTVTTHLVLHVLRAPDGTCVLGRPQHETPDAVRFETAPREYTDSPCGPFHP